MTEVKVGDVLKALEVLAGAAEIEWDDEGGMMRGVRAALRGNDEAMRELAALRDRLNEVLSDG